MNLGVRSGGELDRLVAASKVDVEPSEESVNVFEKKRRNRKSHAPSEKRRAKNEQSFRVAVTSKSASKVRSSFLMVSKSRC